MFLQTLLFTLNLPCVIALIQMIKIEKVAYFRFELHFVKFNLLAEMKCNINNTILLCLY